MVGLPDVTVIVNPNAGGGRAARLIPRAVAALQIGGGEPLVQFTRSLEHATELGRAAAQAGRVPVAAGGDGLVSAVVNAVAGTGMPMGLLPLGRGNDFARSLGIGGLDHGVEILRNGEPRLIDLGWVHDRYFTCIASVGFDSRVLETAEKTKFLKGPLVYPYSTLRALVGYQTQQFRVQLDEQDPRSFVGFSVAAANSAHFGGGMKFAPEASLDDGMIDVVTVGDVSKAGFVRAASGVFWGRHVRHPAVDVARAQRLTIEPPDGLVLYADGEPVTAGRVTIEARARALSLYL